MPPFALVDCNNFYASCERVFRPDLQKRPVVVLSNNDGCIVARSSEAKALNITMGQPYYKQRAALQRQGVAVFSSNYALYGDMSRRVMQSLQRFAPDIEVYSIDESFLDLRGFSHHDLQNWAGELRRSVARWTGITVSVGIAPSKTLSKIANHLAKKNPQLKGVCQLATQAQIDAALKATPVDEVWGIGRRWATRLQARGINTAADLRNANAETMRATFGVVMQRLVLELRGQSCLPLDAISPPRQRILVSRSFARRIDKIAPLRQAVSHHISRAAEKLRRQKSRAGAIMVFVRSSPHDDDAPFYANSHSLTLAQPTQDSASLLRYALRALDKIYKDGPRYQKCGVMLLDLSPEAQFQQALFGAQNPQKEQRRNKLMRSLDRLNRDMGRGTLRFASEGFDDEAWRMQQRLRSPAYTTRWRDIPEAS